MKQLRIWFVLFFGWLFALYNIEPGDRIFVDSGSYASVGDINIRTEDSGSAAGGFVQILGSTNCTTPSLVSRSGSSTNVSAFNIEQAQYLIPAAVSLAYGEIFATLLMLVLVPVLIAVTEDQYIRIATKMANNPEQLSEIRSGLRPRLISSSLGLGFSLKSATAAMTCPDWQ